MKQYVLGFMLLAIGYVGVYSCNNRKEELKVPSALGERGVVTPCNDSLIIRQVFLIDSLRKRTAFLQYAADSLRARTITYEFTYTVIRRWLSLTKARPPLEKYEGGWVARAIDIRSKL